jgi:hypothetical protein
MLSVPIFPSEGTPVLEHGGVGTYRELYIIIYILLYFVKRAWDSSVGIATHYGLDGTEIEFRWARFSEPSRLAMRPNQPPTE